MQDPVAPPGSPIHASPPTPLDDFQNSHLVCAFCLRPREEHTTEREQVLPGEWTTIYVPQLSENIVLFSYLSLSKGHRTMFAPLRERHDDTKFAPSFALHVWREKGV
jgi:hypothetical protein